jgi:hypothetical protein
MFAASFAGAKEPINAIKAAMTCEIFDESAIEVDEEHAEERDLEEAAAGVRYKHALHKLKGQGGLPKRVMRLVLRRCMRTPTAVPLRARREGSMAVGAAIAWRYLGFLSAEILY